MEDNVECTAHIGWVSLYSKCTVTYFSDVQHSKYKWLLARLATFI